MKRIRRCEFCGNIFWADRIDALGCSRRCSNGLRQRRLRGANKETSVEVVSASADDDSDVEFPIRL